MTARTSSAMRNAGAGAVCLVLIAALGTLGYRAIYHVFPGMVPTVVHWCGRDYESWGRQNWAQVTAAERPRQVRVVGSYPPIFGRPLLAAPIAGPVRPGEPCAMDVYLRTGAGRYQAYALEGGP